MSSSLKKFKKGMEIATGAFAAYPLNLLKAQRRVYKVAKCVDAVYKLKKLIK